jgi:uncharacterized protein (DUF433 family)
MVDWKERIVSVPQICHGKPCFRGTRVLVSSILGSLAAGFSREEILVNYAGLQAEDIDAALAFAAVASALAKEQARGR